VALTALVACTTSGTPASAPLEGTHWRLIELNGKPALAAAEERPDLQFARGDSARVSGSSGCNRFMGSFTHTGAELRFGQMASTQMACIDERVNEQERAFLTALGATERYAVAGDTLTLIGSSGPLARFVAESPRAMVDTMSAAVKGNMPLATDMVGWLGDYVYLADAGRFADCASGASYPVAQGGESIALERAYTAARTRPGTPVLVSLRGHLEQRLAMEGDRRVVHLVVDRFEGASPGHECAEITPVGP
jgi:heat shock protein HslJ